MTSAGVCAVLLRMLEFMASSMCSSEKTNMRLVGTGKLTRRLQAHQQAHPSRRPENSYDWKRGHYVYSRSNDG